MKLAPLPLDKTLRLMPKLAGTVESRFGALQCQLKSLIDVFYVAYHVEYVAPNLARNCRECQLFTHFDSRLLSFES